MKMATGLSLILIATGAVLAFAVDYQTQGIDIQAVGAILLVAGIIGMLYSLLFMASFAPFGTRDRHLDSGWHDSPTSHTHDHL
jgi:hypothetical protein